MKTKSWLVVLCCSLMIVAMGALPPWANCAEKIVLSWAGFLPKTVSENVDFQKLFVDRLSEKTKGELVINYRGGPETISQFDLGMAVQKGVIDFAFAPVGFYEPLVPGIGAAMLSELTPWEERKPGGAYYYLLELHKKAGMYYLGRGAPSREPFFFVYLKKKVETQKDFVGLRIGTGTGALAACRAWGTSVTPVKTAEFYNAMERNLVEGVAGFPLDVCVTLGVHEVTNYIIDHPFYVSTAAVFMNLNSWNKLSPKLQNLITETMSEYEKEKMEMEGKRRAEARQKIIAAKVQFYKLSPPVADWYLKTAYDAAWEYQQKRFPEVTSKLRELLLKKK
jgi:TRAP-type C4-dicarboxylate transport system substrate-binding protein